jgi:hypothetical protein
MTEKTITPKQPLEELHQAQRERLCFIDFRLMFLGDIGRQDQVDKFDIANAVFTRDMATYREYAPDNCVLNHKHKHYEVSRGFKSIFEHDVHRVLYALSRGFGEGLNKVSTGYLQAEFPLRLNQPDLAVLAVISRAIHLKKVVHVSYLSFTSGASKRELVPYALVDSGNRWHVRAFDRKANQFRDFALNRISRPELNEGAIQELEHPQNDYQWLRMLTIELVPHPAARFPEFIERDYSMTDGKLVLNLRAAVAGYVLQQWNVDCSEDHSLEPTRYRLWLKHADKVLYQVESALMAPGFKSS